MHCKMRVNGALLSHRDVQCPSMVWMPVLVQGASWRAANGGLRMRWAVQTVGI